MRLNCITFAWPVLRSMRRLSYAKIVQTECNEACFELLRCRLSYAKIVQIADNTKKEGLFLFYGIQALKINNNIMIKTLHHTLALVAIAMVLLSVKVLLRRNGKFSSQHVHDNPGLRKQGIHCVMDQDREARKKNRAY